MAIPAKLLALLQPHQREGIEKLLSVYSQGKAGFSINTRMGGGKTRMVIVSVASIESPQTLLFLVICPLGVMPHWPSEVEKLGLEKEWLCILHHGPNRH